MKLAIVMLLVDGVIATRMTLSSSIVRARDSYDAFDSMGSDASIATATAAAVVA